MPYTIIRLKRVVEKTGISRSQLYLLMEAGKFPRQIELGLRSVGWDEAEIDSWIADRINHTRMKRREIDAQKRCAPLMASIAAGGQDAS